MNDPPINSKMKNTIGLKWDINKKVIFNSTGPKFLLMSRTNSNETLTNVSPFLIKKAIDNTCSTEIEFCKKTRNGQILIKTKNEKQATNLTTLIALSNTISVNITPHSSLNSTKGVIYCNDLRGIPEEEILIELKEQNIIDIKKILKKSGESLVETGLIVLTFNSIDIPNDINIGYMKVNVRPYIPLPLRCKNCIKYGHSAKYCKNNKTCHNCSKTSHINDTENDKCMNAKECLNCKNNNFQNYNHSPIDKSCYTFIMQKEIQTIKTLQKIDHKTATRIYNDRHQQITQTYASTLTQPSTSQSIINRNAKNNNDKSNTTNNNTLNGDNINNTISNKQLNTSRQILNYAELDTDTDIEPINVTNSDIPDPKTVNNHTTPPSGKGNKAKRTLKNTKKNSSHKKQKNTTFNNAELINQSMDYSSNNMED